jgi:hypothetical protein
MPDATGDEWRLLWEIRRPSLSARPAAVEAVNELTTPPPSAALTAAPAGARGSRVDEVPCPPKGSRPRAPPHPPPFTLGPAVSLLLCTSADVRWARRHSRVTG